MTKKKALPFLGFPNLPGRSTTKSPHLHRTAFGAVQVSRPPISSLKFISSLLVTRWFRYTLRKERLGLLNQQILHQIFFALCHAESNTSLNNPPAMCLR